MLTQHEARSLFRTDLFHGVPAALRHETRRIVHALIAGILKNDLCDEQHGLRVAISAEVRRKLADIRDALYIASVFIYKSRNPMLDRRSTNADAFVDRRSLQGRR